MKQRIESLDTFINELESLQNNNVLFEGVLDDDTSDPNISNDKELESYIMDNIGLSVQYIDKR